MSPRSLRVEQALALLPDLDELLPLREALVEASRPDPSRAWAASEAYATVDSRLADADALRARLPEVLEAMRARVEAVYGRAVDAVRAAAAGDDAGAARALVEAGEMEEGAGRVEDAEAFYHQALQLGRRPRDRTLEGLALRRLGRVARSRGALEAALRLYRQGFEVAEAQRDTEGMVVACQGMGNVHGQRGEWAEAERWYLRGLELAGDDPSRERWQLESNLSLIARRAGRLEESGRWVSRAEATVAELGDEAGRYFVHNTRALWHLAREEPAEAERHFRRALELAPGPPARAPALVNLGEALLAQGRLSEAERFLREAERISVAHRVVASLPYVYRGLGALARERRDADGLVFFEQALDLCRAPGAPPWELATTQQEYARFEEVMGDREAALARLREAVEILEGLGAGPERDRVVSEIDRLATGSPEASAGA